MEIVLQERKTLDEVVLEAIETFPNGCNFRLIFHEDKTWIEYGCYGVLVNLATGSEKLLLEWFTNGNKYAQAYRRLLPINPTTRMELLKREPCKICGGPYFICRDSEVDSESGIIAVATPGAGDKMSITLL